MAKPLRDKTGHPGFLSGGGEMGERIRNFDWRKTPLGDPETWENSLKTCVRIILTSAQPMFVWWGPERIHIYNDHYISVLSKKHPAGLGVPAEKVWKEIWPDLTPRIKSVERNEGTYDDALYFIMERKGYKEETCFSFCYSPVPGNDGTVKGLFCVCTEITERVANERAQATLRDLGAVTFKAKSIDVVYRNVAEALGKNPKDFPFAMIYKAMPDGKTLALTTFTGINESQKILPQIINSSEPTNATQGICDAYCQNKLVISNITSAKSNIPKGVQDTAPLQYVHIPITGTSKNHPYAIITAALNPYRIFDEVYRQFCQLMGERISLEINKMLALEEETRRAEQLAELDKAKTVFFSNISHEFRTPLTLILNPLEELLNEKKNNFSLLEKQHLETMHRNSLRLLRLVNTLLDFSRIESGKQQAHFSLVDIVSVTTHLASNFRSTIEKAGMQLIIRADSFIQPVYVDKLMWEKIVFNLLSNAFKYTLKGSITVKLKSEKNFVILKIKDTGVGIPQEELPHMFERFHRVQNVVGRTYEGTGIGLSLIKELVLMHSGSISVESKLHEGSTFIVKIPFGKDHIPAHQLSHTEKYADSIDSGIYIEEIDSLFQTNSLKNHAVEEANTGKKLPRVMVVDDNADMREHIRSVLAKKFKVIAAFNGMDALHKIRKALPDLILTDIMMPVMDGIRLLKEIKSNKETAHIPVIFLTARAGEESKIEGWETGADDYMVKPFSSRELIARVSTNIRNGKIRKEGAKMLEQVFKNSPIEFSILSGNPLCYTVVNDACLKSWGKTQKDVINKRWQEVFPELENNGYDLLLENVMATRQPYAAYEQPIEIMHKEGLRLRYFNFVLQALTDETGEATGVLITGIDVTENVLTRKKIKDLETKLKTTLSMLQ